MKLQLDGLLGWVIMGPILIVAIVIILTGALVVWNGVVVWLIEKLVQQLRVYKRLVDFIWYYKQFRDYMKEKHPKEYAEDWDHYIDRRLERFVKYQAEGKDSAQGCDATGADSSSKAD